MVCASIEKPARIAGGFVLLNVAALMATWRACQARPLGLANFRTWLACHELVARRCHLDDDRSPTYSAAELAKLLDVTEKRARASIRRLEVAGMVRWSATTIDLEGCTMFGPSDPLNVGETHIQDSIGGGKGFVAIPRRMLRYLVAGARPALIATVLGLLLRCLSRRKGGFDGRGRVKASWIARTFAVGIRQVKDARRELIALGWIEAEDSDQWAENRWGRVFRIDLGWSSSGEVEKAVMSTAFTGSTSAPLPGGSGSTSAPPCLHQEPSLPGGMKTQEPGRGPTGFSSEGQREAKPEGDLGKQVLSGPTLTDVQIDDLKDTRRLLDLHRQAVAKGLVTTSEADRLRFIGAAEHALAIADNPTALFAWLLLKRCWRYVTGADEDRANVRLKAFLRGPEPTPASTLPRVSVLPTRLTLPPRSAPPGLSADAQIVKAVREASIRAGIFRDPWPAFQARYPEWDRGRWNAALVELGLQ